MSDTGSQLPQLNAPAPDFRTKTTHGDRGLSDYQGKWLILFSHPAWTRNSHEKSGAKIPRPIVEDIKTEVAGAYGMVHPGAADTQAVRTTEGYKTTDWYYSTKSL